MKGWLVGILVVGGALVGMMSIYWASLSGVMSKMGLVGGDFGQEIDQNALSQSVRSQGEPPDCSVLETMILAPRYLLSRGQERVVLGGELGAARVGCGVRQVQEGNVERGIYTITKGLYYLRSHYGALRSLVQVDDLYCRLLDEGGAEGWVEEYLLASAGRAHDSVYEVYKQVEEARGRVAELCID